MSESRMKRLKGLATQLPKVKGFDPDKPPYERTWDDDNRPTIPTSTALLATARLADFAKISIEEAKEQIYRDFNVVKQTVRVRPSTVAKAAWQVKHDRSARVVDG